MPDTITTAAPTVNAAKLGDAANRVADTFADTMLADDLATRLTCQELDALADLLEAAGYLVAAETWREAHAEGDEEGDAHYVA